jgi:hypothetical protein
MLRLALPLSILAALPAFGAPVLLNSFEDDASVQALQTASATIARTPDHATDGQSALKATFGVTEWPHVWFNLGKACPTGDWRKAGAFVFDAYNPDDEPMTLYMRMDDDARADGVQHCRYTSAVLPPKQRVTVAFPLMEQDPFMRGGPPPSCKADILRSLSPNVIDLGRIIAFQFFMDHPKRERTVTIDNVRLERATSLDGIVDRFGQFTGAEWLGKVHTEEDLAKCRADEAAQLKTAPVPADRDEWGGWAKGPTLEATGWFRTEKVDGKWWLVTPGGHVFWSVGLDCVRPDGSGPTKDRENLFTWLPEKDDTLAIFGAKGSGEVNFWGMNIHRKYGPQWETPWLDMTRNRMRAWGFNTVGNWSWDRSYSELRVPCTVPIHYGGEPTFSGGAAEIPDFYTDAWAQAVEGAVKGVTGRWRDDPYCVGYFVDNELSWCGWDAKDSLKLPENALKLPGDREIKQAFTKLLRDKYTDIAKLNAAWGTAVTGWDVFQAQPVSPSLDEPAVRADLSLLLSDFAKRYFTVVSGLMRQYAPHQMYLGPRFAVGPDECVREAAKVCDVVTYNFYGRAPGSILSHAEQVKTFDKPVLIGEFHFGALDRGMFHEGLGPVANQEERGVEYARYIQTALDQPWCVGAHWFTYGDEPLTGRFDGENYNIGFVNVTDTPYVELVRHATEINFAVYQKRGG